MLRRLDLLVATESSDAFELLFMQFTIILDHARNTLDPYSEIRKEEKFEKL